MRKIVLLVAIMFLFSALIPFSEAVRSNYYTYKSKRDRHFSDRIGPFRYRAPRKSEENRHYWKNLSHKKYKPYLSQYTSPHLSRVQNTKPQSKLFETKRFQVLKRRGYTLTPPAGFRRGKDGIYRNRFSSLTFRVVKTPAKYQCVQTSFELCAINLGKGFSRSQHLRQITNHVTRSHYIYTQSDKKVPAYTEKFEGTVFGSENVYFLFNALNPEDNSVIRIEAVAHKRAQTEAAKMMFEVFKSFHF